ncbi:MAG: SEC-C domain-containing protein, partial [Desulfovibrio sp.]|nr:SEC-C domain-containing protein [Desulfovibrio sp.]
HLDCAHLGRPLSGLEADEGRDVSDGVCSASKVRSKARWRLLLGLWPECQQGVLTMAKIGRNDPCPCVSGKKYMH